MSLQDFRIKCEYRTFRDDVVNEFFLPLLSEAVVYKRAVGYFSSSSLIELSKGIAELAKKGGNIQIVASPYLSEDDIEAIDKGYKSRDNVIEKILSDELDKDVDFNYYEKERLNLLANLIADGILDIKIAFVEKNSSIGMYHEKMGIIEDSEGNKIAFSGSNNESVSGMYRNYETIDTFRSWSAAEEIRNRVYQKDEAFSHIWNDIEPNMKVLKFPSIEKKIIDKYKVGKANFQIDNEEYPMDKILKEANKEYITIKPGCPRIPDTVKLYDYQKQAIKKWEEYNYKGIFDMATGTGKTYTALGAISTLSEKLDDKLAVIIVCPYQHLVEQWVEDIKNFGMKPIIGYSASPQKRWKYLLADAIRSEIYNPKESFLCFICTNATFASDYVQKQIKKIKISKLLVVDEAHNFGAKYLSKLLTEIYDYRLALSATLERHMDSKGTKILYDFFKKKCIEYDLERAIKENKLTKYYYYPIVVYLNDDELLDYKTLTAEIGKCIIKDKFGKSKLSKKGEFLAIKRSRIVAGASNKLIKLREAIEPYKDKKNILIYCGAAQVLDEGFDKTGINEGEIRQIDAVTKILGIEIGMKVAQFTSNESMEERSVLKDRFENGDDLQALVAIKCLDEGVNIPGINTAFILASSTNPKEYIQRRGRVLRKAPGKKCAYIYDFITLPRPINEAAGLTEIELSAERRLILNEISRMEEFCDLSLNPMDAKNLVFDLKNVYKRFYINNESE